MRRLSQIGQRPHAGAVSSEREHTPFPKQLHAIGIWIGITGRLTVEDIGNEAATFGQRPVVLVGIIAAEQHDITKVNLPMLLLKTLHMLGSNQRTRSLGSFVEYPTHVDNTRFAAELPRLDLVGISQAERSRFLPL